MSSVEELRHRGGSAESSVTSVTGKSQGNRVRLHNFRVDFIIILHDASIIKVYGAIHTVGIVGPWQLT